MELKVTSFEVSDGVGELTLRRPHRRNAWTGRMHHEVRWAMDAAERDPAVRAVIVTGEGSAFCVGGDAAALSGHVDKGGYDPGTPTEMPTPASGTHPALEENFTWMLAMTTPVIAAVNGPAAGVGLALAVYADLRWVAADARLTTAHGPLNLPAEYGLSWMLPRLIGLTAATELLLTSRKFTGTEAAELGLANGALPADEVLPHCRRVARDMLDRVGPAALRATKRQIWLDQLRDVGASVREADRLLDELSTTADFAEGVAALNERRPPRWTDS